MTATLPVSEVFGPTIQGEGPAAGQAAMFVRLMGCNLSCSWCLVPGTLILRPDFTCTPVELLEVGDSVLGRTNPDNGKHGQLVEATVTHVARRDAPLVRVNGDLVCAADTRFWTSRNRSAHSGWRNVERCESLDCTFLAAPVMRDQAKYQWGYLAGMADGDGCFWTLRSDTGAAYRRYRLARANREILARVKQYAAESGYRLRDGEHTSTGFSGVKVTMPALWLTDSVQATLFEKHVQRTPDSDSWAWGYLAGIFDADGHLGDKTHLRIGQSPETNGPTYERAVAVAERLGFDVAREAMGIRLCTSGGELWRFLVNATPCNSNALGRAPNNVRTIHSVEEAGRGEVVSLTTSAGNYVANGWLVHNCDTPYTWDGHRFNLRAETTHLSPAAIAERVAAGGAGIVVITGGEPLLHQDKPGWITLLGLLLRKHRIHIETNGTKLPNWPTLRHAEVICVSPKLPNAGKHRGRQDPTIHPELGEHARRYHNLHLKVVCTGADDVAAAAQLATEQGWPAGRVWVMPEGTTRDTLAQRWPLIADAAIKHGLNATHRLHVMAWGDERGH